MAQSDRMTFQCRELVYSLFRFTEAEFSLLDLEQEFGRWSEELESNSTATPLMVGSIFDDDDDHLDLEAVESNSPAEDTIYVVAYYFYESSEYSVCADVDATWKVVQRPILSGLCDSDGIKYAVPMAYVASADRDEHFECNDSSDGTEKKIAVFRGPTQVFECNLDRSVGDFKRGVLDALGWAAKGKANQSAGGRGSRTTSIKCIQCGHELAGGAKFCPECGSKQELKCGACGAALRSGVKFCPECGAKSEAAVGAGGTAAGVVSRIDLVPSPLGLPDCPVTFQEVSAEGPNEDNELRITVKYQITNDTEKDWEYFEVQTKLLSASGQIVEESNDTQEQAVSAGESADFESSFWGIKQAALGGNPEQAHIVVTATACGFAQQELGEVDIPETAYDPVALKPAKVGDVVQLVGGSLWKTPVDDDKECHVEVKALVQNLTSHYLPQVKVIAEVTDKSGREVTDAGGSGEIRPGALSAINGSGWEKEKKFKGAKAALSIRAYWPVATGMSQQQGMVITAGERNEDEPEGHVGNWPFTTDQPGGSTRGTLVAKWAMLMQIETPDRLIQGEEEISAFIKSRPDLVSLAEENVAELTTDWRADTPNVSSVHCTAHNVGLFTTSDRLGIKWLQVEFNCELSDPDNSEEAKEELRFGFVPTLELHDGNEWVKLIFTDLEDATVEFSAGDSSDAAGNGDGVEVSRMTGRLIDARIGVIRRDWNPEKYGDEISFWSRDNPQIFEIDNEPVEDYAIEALLVKALFVDGVISVSIKKYGADASLTTFLNDDSDKDEEFGGARKFIADAIESIVAEEVLADDTAWLILNNGTSAAGGDAWTEVVKSNWDGEAGGGDQIHISEAKYAGGLFIDVVSYHDISVEITDGEMEFDSDEADDKLDDSSRFVGVGISKSGVEPDLSDLDDVLEGIKQFVRNEELDHAKDLCTKALEQHSDSGELHNILGVIQFNLGDTDFAAQQWEKAVELSPSLEATWSNLGALYSSQEKHSEAARCWREVISLNPEDKVALNNLGVALMNMEQNEEAEAQLLAATRLDKSYADPWFNLGKLCFKSGMLSKAKLAFERVLASRPEDENAVIGLHMVTPLLAKREGITDKEKYLSEVAAAYRRWPGR